MVLVVRQLVMDFVKAHVLSLALAHARSLVRTKHLLEDVMDALQFAQIHAQ